MKLAMKLVLQIISVLYAKHDVFSVKLRAQNWRKKKKTYKKDPLNK